MRRLQAFATIAVLFKSTTTAVKRNQAPFDDAWTRCRDLETWRGAGGDHVTCAWVAAAPQSRCESKAVDGFSAIDACDCSCGNHEPAPRAGAVASADETWGPDAAAPAENFEDAEDAPSLLQKARKVPAGAVAIKSDLWDDEGQPPGRDCTGARPRGERETRRAPRAASHGSPPDRPEPSRGDAAAGGGGSLRRGAFSCFFGGQNAAPRGIGRGVRQENGEAARRF